MGKATDKSHYKMRLKKIIALLCCLLFATFLKSIDQYKQYRQQIVEQHQDCLSKKNMNNDTLQK